MAGGMDVGQGGGKGKKPLDATINLVPFIDLMAVTIVFLMISATWTQLGRLQVAQAGNSAESEPETPPTTQPITLLITDKELKLQVGGVPLDPMPITRDDGGRLEVARLTERLKDLKNQQPDQNAITLSTEDAVLYDDLVRIIDTCIGSSFPSVSVSPASS